jgi:hypothetical protein
LIPLVGKIRLPWDVILLHNFSDGADTKKDCFRVFQQLDDEFSLLALLDEPCSSGAYLITQEGARRMPNLRPGTTKFDCASDYWIWLAYRGECRIAVSDRELGNP